MSNLQCLPIFFKLFKPKKTLTVQEDLPTSNLKNIFEKNIDKFKVSSVNCKYKIIDGVFYKVQIVDKDPLLYELLFMKFLNDKDTPKIFPVYKDHFLFWDKE